MKNLISFFILWCSHVISFNLLYDVLWWMLECRFTGIGFGMLIITEKIVFFVLSFVLSVFEIYKNKKAKTVLVILSGLIFFRFGIHTYMIGNILKIYCVLCFSEIVGLLVPYFIYGKVKGGIFSKDSGYYDPKSE